jgi:ribosome recycling factor
MKLTNSEVLPDPCLLGKGVDMPLTLGAYLQALAEQLAGEIDIRNDRSTGEQIISYFDWAKEQAMGMTRKLAELEARTDVAPSRAQIEWWEKEAVATLKQEFHDAFLASPQGVQAMEEMVRTVHMNEVTVEARRNVVRMAETGLLNNKGKMLGIKREARAILMARFSAESNDQEDEWRRAYFERLMERLKNGHTDACLAPPETSSQFVQDVARAINAEVESHVDRLVRTIESTAREAYAEETQHIVA